MEAELRAALEQAADDLDKATNQFAQQEAARLLGSEIPLGTDGRNAPRFAEKAALARAALAAHRPVRERRTLYRVVGTRAEDVVFVYPSQEDGSSERPSRDMLAEWDVDAPNLAPHRVQSCEVTAGPWQDVTDEGGEG